MGSGTLSIAPRAHPQSMTLTYRQASCARLATLVLFVSVCGMDPCLIFEYTRFANRWLQVHQIVLIQIKLQSMNDNIRKLHRIASAKSRTIIGLMSGTSLDGLDIALCKVSGSGTGSKLELRRFTTVSYTNEEKERILKVFAKPEVDFQALCELNPWIANLHADMILKS